MNLCLGLITSAISRTPFYIEHQTLGLVIYIFVGILIGFLVNYLADVLPSTRRLSSPVCPECEHRYSLKEYLISPRCPNCRDQRTRTILVLIVSVILSFLLRFFPFPGLNYWTSLPLFAYLGVITVIDLEHRLVLIETSLFGIALFLIYGTYFHDFLGTLAGGLGGLVIMLSFYILGMLFGKVVGILRGKAINQVPFGFGDVVFGMILGLLSGWPLIAAAILLGILIFGAYSFVWLIVLILTKRYQSFHNAQALTPFLILGTIILFYL